MGVFCSPYVDQIISCNIYNYHTTRLFIIFSLVVFSIHFLVQHQVPITCPHSEIVCGIVFYVENMLLVKILLFTVWPV